MGRVQQLFGQELTVEQIENAFYVADQNKWIEIKETK